MPLKKKCSSSLHIHDEDKNPSPIQNLENSKKLSISVVAFMVEKRFISAIAKYLCTQCYDKGVVEYDQTEKTSKKPKLDCYTPSELCELIINNEIEQNIISSIASVVGKYLNCKLTGVIDRDFGNKEKLEHLSFASEISCCDTVLCEFLFALSGSTNNDAALLNAAENLIYLINPNYTSKLNFSLSYISLLMTGSKSVVEIRGKYSPSGSYSTLLKYLDRYSVKNV